MNKTSIPSIDSIWIRPNFQWKIRVLDHSDPLWDDMASMEVSLMKGVAYDLTLTTEGESYALVIDSRFTQPPHDFQVRVGLDQLTLDVTGTFTNLLDILNIFNGADDSALEVTLVSYPLTMIFFWMLAQGLTSIEKILFTSFLLFSIYTYTTTMEGKSTIFLNIIRFVFSFIVIIMSLNNNFSFNLITYTLTPLVCGFYFISTLLSFYRKPLHPKI